MVAPVLDVLSFKVTVCGEQTAAGGTLISAVGKIGAVIVTESIEIHVVTGSVIDKI